MDPVLPDCRERGEIGVLPEPVAQFPGRERVRGERGGELGFGGRRRGEDEGDEAGVDLAGFGVGRVRVGEDGGERGVL